MDVSELQMRDGWSDHHRALALQEIDRLQNRIDALKNILNLSAAPVLAEPAETEKRKVTDEARESMNAQGSTTGAQNLSGGEVATVSTRKPLLTQTATAHFSVATCEYCGKACDGEAALKMALALADRK